MNGDGPLYLIAELATEGHESVSANVLPPRDFYEFKKFKALSEVLDDS